jgi:hypothetical protein
MRIIPLSYSLNMKAESRSDQIVYSHLETSATKANNTDYTLEVSNQRLSKTPSLRK